MSKKQKIKDTFSIVGAISLIILFLPGVPAYLEGLFLGEGLYWSNTTAFNDTLNTFITPNTLIHHEVFYTAYLDTITRKAVLDMWGGTNTLSSVETIDPTTNLTLTSGTSKLLLAVVSGSDVVGEIKITGTYRNRTSWELVNTTETITLDGLTTEVVEGLEYTNAYLTSFWWTNTITIWTTNANINHLDVVQLAFDQVGEHQNYTIEELDVTFRKSNANGGVNSSFYSVEDGNNRVNVTKLFTLETLEGSGVGDAMYRQKRNNGILFNVNGSHSGFFVRIIPLPLTQSYIEDMTVRVSMTIWETLGSRETTGN